MFLVIEKVYDRKTSAVIDRHVILWNEVAMTTQITAEENISGVWNNFLTMGVHRNFSRGGQSRQYAYLFQFVGDASQMDVHKNVQCYGNSYIQCFPYKIILHW